MSLSRSILFVYGVGGHEAQMSRLYNKLCPFIHLDYKNITFSDSRRAPSWSNHHYTSVEVRSKHSLIETLVSFAFVRVFVELVRISRSYKICVVVSSGPGISVLSALFFRVLGAKVVHVETWSRFETYSFTGRIMYYISDKFYVQNRPLMKLYPKAIYTGLL